MTDQQQEAAAPPHPIQAAPRRDLIGFALNVEAFGEAFSDYASALTQELRERAVQELQTEGTRASWDAKGLGRVTLAVPEPKLGVTDPAALANWLAQRRPEQVVATIEVKPEDLPNIMALLAEQGYDADSRAALSARDSYVKSWLDPKKGGVDVIVGSECPPECGPAYPTDCPDHPPVTRYYDKATGEEVPGLTLHPAKAPYISKSLDGQAKERVRVAVHSFLTQRLAGGIPMGGNDPLALLASPATVPTAAAPPPPPLPAADDQPAADDTRLVAVMVCTCGHTTGQHRKGAQRYGKCLADCRCIRFTHDKERT